MQFLEECIPIYIGPIISWIFQGQRITGSLYHVWILSKDFLCNSWRCVSWYIGPVSVESSKVIGRKWLLAGKLFDDTCSFASFEGNYGWMTIHWQGSLLYHCCWIMITDEWLFIGRVAHFVTHFRRTWWLHQTCRSALAQAYSGVRIRLTWWTRTTAKRWTIPAYFSYLHDELELQQTIPTFLNHDQSSTSQFSRSLHLSRS